MLLFVGLGNPGADYARNRHNIGFMAADAIAQRHGFGPWRKRFHALVAEGMLDGEKVIAVKPQTFMNKSGRAVGEALRFYKLEPSSAVVFYDELDLAPGKVRVKLGGGRGSHNGIRDIVDHVGADFWRVRIGIGHPGHKDAVIGHVLKDFAKSDRAWVEALCDAMAAAAPKLAAGDANGFMNRVSVALQPAKDGKDPANSARKAAAAPTAKPPPLAGDRSASATERPQGALQAALARVFGRGSSD